MKVKMMDPKADTEVRLGNRKYKRLYYYFIGCGKKVSKTADVELTATGLLAYGQLTEKGTMLFHTAREQGPAKDSRYIAKWLLAFGPSYKITSRYDYGDGLYYFDGGIALCRGDAYIGDWLHSLGLMDQTDTMFVWNAASRTWLIEHKEVAEDVLCSNNILKDMEKKATLVSCLPIEDLHSYLAEDHPMSTEAVRETVKRRISGTLALTPHG